MSASQTWMQLDLSLRAGPHVFVQLCPIHRQRSISGITRALCAELCCNPIILQKMCASPPLSPFGAVDSLGSGASSGCSVHLFWLIKWINVSFPHFDLHFCIHLEGKKGRAKQANFSSMIGSHLRQKAWCLIPVLKKAVLNSCVGCMISAMLVPQTLKLLKMCQSVGHDSQRKTRLPLMLEATEDMLIMLPDFWASICQNKTKTKNPPKHAIL